ncbi:hypothetical protein C8J56DRAFT_948615 [Mycena floridula]|nr:hypothetical protein C8J56DRAFT_948615 [Mycena floridula]
MPRMFYQVTLALYASIALINAAPMMTPTATFSSSTETTLSSTETSTPASSSSTHRTSASILPTEAAVPSSATAAVEADPLSNSTLSQGLRKATVVSTVQDPAANPAAALLAKDPSGGLLVKALLTGQISTYNMTAEKYKHKRKKNMNCRFTIHANGTTADITPGQGDECIRTKTAAKTTQSEVDEGEDEDWDFGAA